MEEEGVRQPSGPPTRKKFFIPLGEDEAPPAGLKPLFKATQSFPATETSPQAAPQTYAEYAISGPPGGAGAPHPTGPETVAGEPPGQAPKPGTKSSSIIVSPRQRGNPVLKFVRNVPWEFGDVLPDYVLGQSTCALFLSLRYHNLHPDYIHGRLQSLGKSFALRVLLVQVDVKDPQKALKELAKMCILADCTLVLAWRRLDGGICVHNFCITQKSCPALKFPLCATYSSLPPPNSSSFYSRLSFAFFRVSESWNHTICSRNSKTHGSPCV
ncbi:DNA excision repair protein ERCC-1 isoform X1 [Crocuta crocuta]